MFLTLLMRMTTAVAVVVVGSDNIKERTIYEDEPTCFNFSHQIIPFCIFSIPLVAIALRFRHI